ncbi:MAG: sodium:alanine symporter family protein [Bacteroidetes bacterium]|nr:sodium:alanine symporter family protein [Bacteroidota bacterium]
MNLINVIHNILCGPIFILLLLGIGLFFTIYLKFPQIRLMPKSIKLLLGIDKSSGSKKGDTSAFQALATSLGGSIGVGCIAGTGVAINIGGPSSIFWMIITTFLGMATKFVEVTLCHKYRKKLPDGSISGTPMHFLKEQLNMPKLAIIMALATIATSIFNNLPQVNSIAKAFYFSFNINEIITGLILSIAIFIIIVGGIKRIGALAEKLIPIMTLIFLILSLASILANYNNIIPALKLMFVNPFKGSAALGGFLGASINMTMIQGVNRGYYTNDAGSGASGIAHAASEEENSYNEGVFSIIEPFLCTAIMCSLTALVIIASNTWNTKYVNKLDKNNIIFLKDLYSEDKKEDIVKLSNFINNNDNLPLLNSVINIENGKIENQSFSVVSNRSIAKDLRFYLKDNDSYNGSLTIKNGKIEKLNKEVIIKGKTLLTGIGPVTKALEKSIFSKWGPYLMNICILLFGITTIIAWYYYGDRGLVFLGLRKKGLFYFKIIFTILLFLGSIIDTTTLWKFCDIVYAIMAIPNLIGLFKLRKIIKNIMINKGK